MPISSTGHLILVEDVQSLMLLFSSALFYGYADLLNKLNSFKPGKNKAEVELAIVVKVLVATLPLLLVFVDDWFDTISQYGISRD